MFCEIVALPLISTRNMVAPNRAVDSALLVRNEVDRASELLAELLSKEVQHTTDLESVAVLLEQRPLAQRSSDAVTSALQADLASARLQLGEPSSAGSVSGYIVTLCAVRCVLSCFAPFSVFVRLIGPHSSTLLIDVSLSHRRTSGSCAANSPSRN